MATSRPDSGIRGIEFPALGQVRVVDLPPLPALGADEVLLRTDYLGICGTDLHVLHGKHPWVRPPVITGHEAVATIVALGARVTGFETGELVVLNPLVTCGHCRACLAGRPNHCADGKVFGFRLPGAGRTTFSAPAKQLHKVPAGLDPRLAVLAEPLAVGIHAAARAADLARVLIIGGGTIGLSVLLAVVARGAAQVDVVEPVEAKRELAMAFGAAAVMPPADLAGSAHYTAVFDCVASQGTLDQACEAVVPGGSVVVVGIAEAARHFPLPRLQRFESDILGSGMYVPADIDAALQALAVADCPAARLISAIHDIEGAPEAYAHATRPENTKTLIKMN